MMAQVFLFDIFSEKDPHLNAVERMFLNLGVDHILFLPWKSLETLFNFDLCN